VGQVVVDISMSLDGYVAGPNPSLEDPLGTGGESLHEWVVGLAAWREVHGKSGGEKNVDSAVVEEHVGAVGATIMGRKMFSGGSGGWEDDPRASGWWGDEPPFHHPVFVLTHHEREPLELTGTTFTFVTDGIESALEQARAGAGDKNVAVAGGGEAIDQYLRAGLVDLLQVHVAPVFLGGGTRLFDGHLTDAPARLDADRLVESPTGVAHLRYRLRP
jgi:dihydrofolate reductase